MTNYGPLAIAYGKDIAKKIEFFQHLLRTQCIRIPILVNDGEAEGVTGEVG